MTETYLKERSLLDQSPCTIHVKRSHSNFWKFCGTSGILSCKPGVPRHIGWEELFERSVIKPCFCFYQQKGVHCIKRRRLNAQLPSGIAAAHGTVAYWATYTGLVSGDQVPKIGL